VAGGYVVGGMKPVTDWRGPADLGPGVLAAFAFELEGGTLTISSPEPGVLGFALDGQEIRFPVSAAREIAAFVLVVTGSDEDLVETLARLGRAFSLGEPS
jgi:hypothetical protein